MKKTDFEWNKDGTVFRAVPHPENPWHFGKRIAALFEYAGVVHVFFYNDSYPIITLPTLDEARRYVEAIYQLTKE